MNIDCLFTSLLYSDIITIIKCLSATRLIHNYYTEHFWKQLYEREDKREVEANISWYKKYKLQHKFNQIRKVLYVKNNHVKWKTQIIIRFSDCDNIGAILTIFKHENFRNKFNSRMLFDKYKYYGMEYYMDYRTSYMFNKFKKVNNEKEIIISCFNLIKKRNPDIIGPKKELEILYGKLKNIYSELI